ncbi:MAG: hypothetical protein ABW321_17050 [Polyangiales bacterium]
MPDQPVPAAILRRLRAFCLALPGAGQRFFVADWGTRWATKVVGLKLTGRVDWREVEVLLGESDELLAGPERRR